MLTLTLVSDGAETDIPQAMSISYNNAIEVVVLGKDGKEICKATPQYSEPVAEEPAPPAEPVVEAPPEPVVDTPPAPPAE